MIYAKVPLYKINELSPEAFEKAYYEWMSESDYPFARDNEESLCEFCKIFSVNVTDYRYGDGYPYIEFELNQESEIKNLSGIRLYKYLMNNYYDLYFIKPLRFIRITNDDRRIVKESKVLFEKYDCSLTGYYMDDILLKPFYEFLQYPNKYVTFYGLIETALNDWVKACDEDFNYYFSEENFKDIAETNDWLYLEDGTRFYSME